MAKIAAVFTSLTLLLSFALLVSSEDCAYIIHLKTGDKDGAGTDANVEVALYDAQDYKLDILNLWKYGIMESGHDYFEQDNLDYFSFRTPCADFCKIGLGQNNMGFKAGWYVAYLKITTDHDDGHCTTKTFEINQWLATSEPPYTRYLTRDLCTNSIQFNNTKPLLQLPVSI